MPDIVPRPQANARMRNGSVGGRARGRLLLTAGLSLAIAIGAGNALPHMGEAIWQDEAVTLMFYSAQGIAFPFLHYGLPNNHIGFSAMLAAWMALFADGVGIGTLRLLPLLLFLLAIPATFVGGARLAGAGVGIMAALLFASSAVAGNFATQLRGYGPSWLFLLLALIFALPPIGADRRGLRLAAYALATLATVAILPTNLVFAMVVAVAASLVRLASPPEDSRRLIAQLACLVLTPPACLLIAHAGALDALFRLGGVSISPWSGAGLLVEWWRATLWDIRWIAPLAGAGLLLGAWEWRDPSLAPRERNAWLVSFALVVGFAAAIVLMPNPPFPRTLVPFLPVWFCALAYLGAHALRAAYVRRRRLALVLAFLAGSLPFAWSDQAPCRGDPGRGGAFDYDLCHQYFRDDYQPELIIRAWAALDSPGLPIVAGYEGFYALRVLGSGAPVRSSRDFRSDPRQPPLIVAASRDEFTAIRAQVGAAGQNYALLADTGYFKVFAPVRRP
jgi:hypothetical protein